MVTTIMQKQIRMENIGPENADEPEEEYVHLHEQSAPLKRIGARVNLSKVLNVRIPGEDDDEGIFDASTRDRRDDFFSDSSNDDGDAGGSDSEQDKQDAGVPSANELRKANARDNAAQAVKAGAALIGSVLGVLTRLAFDPAPERELTNLHIFLVADTQELAGICHFVTWIRMFAEGLRNTCSRKFNILLDVAPCAEHGQATAYEESVKHLVQYVGLAAKDRLKVLQFQASNEMTQQDFHDRQVYEKHFHGFHRTLLAGMPWTFAQKDVGAGERPVTIEVLESPHENRLQDAIEDIKCNKPEQLFCCGSWGGIAFNRWLKVDAVFKAIITQGYFGLPVLGGGVEYHDDATGEAVSFSEKEQAKLREIAVCAKISGLGSHRAQATTLTAPQLPEDCENYERNMHEGALRARHCSGLFSGAEKMVERREAEIQRLKNVGLDFKERSGARYQFQAETGTRNELDAAFQRKSTAEIQELAAKCRSRHADEYRKRAEPAKRTLDDLTQGDEPGSIKNARVQLLRRETLREKMLWFKRHLFLSRVAVANFSRAATDPFSRPLKLQLPGSKSFSDVPAHFGQAAEAAILRAAAVAGEAYLQERVNDGGEVVNVAAPSSSSAVRDKAATTLTAALEEALATALERAVKLAKTNTKAAGLYQKLAPLRDRGKTLVVELMERKAKGSKGQAQGAAKKQNLKQTSYFAVHWDIGRPDRASLVRLEPVQPEADAFVQLGGWGDDPTVLDFQEGGCIKQEEELSRFYPSLAGYEKEDLPPAFRGGEIDPPVIRNDPYMLYTIETQVHPMTGVDKLLKAVADKGPNNESEREKKTTSHSKDAQDLFVYNAAVRRSWKITKSYQYLSSEIFGLGELMNSDDENERAVREYERQMQEREMLDEEERDDGGWNLIGVASGDHDLNATTLEPRRRGRPFPRPGGRGQVAHLQAPCVDRRRKEDGTAVLGLAREIYSQAFPGPASESALGRGAEDH
eukprot:g7802.t1